VKQFKKTVGRWADGRMGGLVEPPSRSIGAAITACAPLIIASEMHGSQRSKVDYHYHVRPLAELQRNSVKVSQSVGPFHALSVGPFHAFSACLFYMPFLHAFSTCPVYSLATLHQTGQPVLYGGEPLSNSVP
jgi:hypothetical protein